MTADLIIIALCLLAYAVTGSTAIEAASRKRVPAPHARQVAVIFVASAILAALFVFGGCHLQPSKLKTCTTNGSAGVTIYFVDEWKPCPPQPRRIVVHDQVPCTTPLPPPAPLEEFEADPHDGATHDRIVCGQMDPWECAPIRNAIWKSYGQLAAIYIEMIRAECARGMP